MKNNKTQTNARVIETEFVCELCQELFYTRSLAKSHVRKTGHIVRGYEKSFITIKVSENGITKT